MERRPFGRTGAEVPVVGQGTWQLRDPAHAEAALRAGLALGMTHVDTAELYRGSEEIVARALRGRRDDVFLVSKVLPRNASAEGTRRACEASLRRLGTDRLDAYLLHWNDGAHPFEETMGALADLVDEGKVRHAGVSNLDVEELEEAQAALPRGRLACDQVLYHLGDRGIEHELLPHCARQGIAVVAYSPFGGPGAPWPPGGASARRVLEEVGARHGRTPRQVCLAFLARHPNVFVIPKAESVAHVTENAGAAGWALDEEDVERLDRAFPAGRPRALGMI